MGKINLNKNNIVITTGGSEAVLFVFNAIADPGDEIIIPEPFYTNYNGFATLSCLKIVPITTLAERGFHLPDISEIEKKIIAFREESKIPVLGVTSSNVRRQLKRLRDVFLIEKKKNFYKITENAPLLETFEEKYEKFLLESCLKRVKDYLDAIDKEFKIK